MARSNRSARKETAADSSSQAIKSPSAPTTDGDVARRAYDLYVARGQEHGYDIQDWLQAERELRCAPLSKV